MSGETSWQQRHLVHLRSSYNKKFLVLASEGNTWVVAGADEPETDQSKWSCTLFKVVIEDNRLRLFLLSANVEYGVEITQPEQCLSIVTDSTSDATLFDITDLDSLAMLPKYVAFKGDNGKYLAARPIKGHKWLKYDSTNPLERRVHHECITLPNGNVRLKSYTYNFWKRQGDDWIMCSSDEPVTNRNTLFRPVRQDNQGNTIALKNLGNDKYCNRHRATSNPKKKSTLRATASTVVPRAVMQVEEIVKEREIYDVDYRVEDARMYDVGLANNIRKSANNLSETNEATATLTFTYTKMTRETFSSSHSWKVKVSIQMKARIPVLVKGTIRLDASYEGSTAWSKTKETTEEISSSVRVVVPPRTTTTITMLIGRGSIDVPYSYTQRDILYDGRVVKNRMHDGIFSGLNTEMIDYTIEEEILSDSQLLSLQAEAARSAMSKL
ncbi:hypothetical protein BVRB_1g005860 [Beta vulgaris subsp. vulgaris]|nr:hypothetical protein BVRB_1g005860 [Beta vulgaris subsp. vulgaris]